jgi:hypothetical protein
LTQQNTGNTDDQYRQQSQIQRMLNEVHGTRAKSF